MGQESSGDQYSPATAKAAVIRGVAHYTDSVVVVVLVVVVGCSKAVEGPLAVAQLTTVLLEGGDIIRGCTSEYRMWDIINKLTLFK